MFSKYLGFRLRLSLSLKGRMAICRQNSCRITIPQIWIKLVKQPSGNLETKQLPYYHLTIQPTFPEWLNGILVTVLMMNCHSAVQTQTQTQMEPEAYRMHLLPSLKSSFSI